MNFWKSLFTHPLLNPIGSAINYIKQEEKIEQQERDITGLQNVSTGLGTQVIAYQTEADKIIAAELAKRQREWTAAEMAKDAQEAVAQQQAQNAQVQKILMYSFIGMLVLILAFIIIKKRLKK